MIFLTVWNNDFSSVVYDPSQPSNLVNNNFKKNSWKMKQTSSSHFFLVKLQKLYKSHPIVFFNIFKMPHHSRHIFPYITVEWNKLDVSLKVFHGF